MRALVSFALLVLAPLALADGPTDLGTRLEPFFDTFLVDRLESAELRLHEPQLRENVLAFDAPWEGKYCGYVTVFQDNGKYRMYYRGLPMAGADGSTNETTCYAESLDGITWEKPKLGLYAIDGSKDNNVVLAGMAPFSHNFAPFPDTHPHVAPDARYKALAGTSETGLVAFQSSDGMTWTRMQDGPVITEGAFDSQNVAFWSESEQSYVCYFRTWSKGGYDGIRTVSRATSDDFLHWSEPVVMDFGDTPREHLYTNQTRPYYRAPHLYIALAARFMPGRRVVSLEQAQTLGGDTKYSGDCSDTVFITSRGGTRYDRTFMEGFVRPGIGLSNWTSRTNYPAWGVVPTGENEISFYVQRNYGQPTHHLQRLSLRVDGFASVHAPYDGGEMVTKPLTFTGPSLYLNMATSAAGSVWVELQDEAGQPIPGFTREDCDEIIGDELAHKVTWKSNADLQFLAGKPVRLRVVMKDADLYAIQFR